MSTDRPGTLSQNAIDQLENPMAYAHCCCLPIAGFRCYRVAHQAVLIEAFYPKYPQLAIGDYTNFPVPSFMTEWGSACGTV